MLLGKINVYLPKYKELMWALRKFNPKELQMFANIVQSAEGFS